MLLRAINSNKMTLGASRGAFILFEGVDRCGKTTQCGKLVEALQARGVPAELWNFPDRKTSIGGLIDSYLKGTTDADDAAIHLLFSVNRWEKRRALVDALRAGKTLVIDRYAFSGVAYTAAKALPGLDLDWCKAPDAGLPAPDLVFYMQLSKEVAAQRAGFGEERYEKAEFQAKVKACFDALKTSAPGWSVVNAEGTIEDIHATILAQADAVVQRCHEGAPLLRLWDYAPYGGQTGAEPSTAN